MPRKKRKEHINNADFLEEVKKYQKNKIDLLNSIDSSLKMDNNKLKKFKLEDTWDENTEDGKKKIALYLSKHDKLISNKLGTMLMELVKDYAKIPSFNGYKELDDMKSEAVIACIGALDKFSVSESNPFAYFTTVSYHAFLLFLKKKYDIDNFKMDLMEEEYHKNGLYFVNEIKRDIETEKKKNFEKVDDE